MKTPVKEMTYRELLLETFAALDPGPLELVIDGVVHRKGVCCRESIMGSDCSRCPARVHEQPVYGGIAYECEGCGSSQWYPAGTFLRDELDFEIGEAPLW